jgi:hypothetical protein
MDIEVKNIKIHDKLSHETFCFSANVWADGELVAEAENMGSGGMTTVRPIYKANTENPYGRIKEVQEYCESKTGGNIRLDELVDAAVGVEWDKKELRRIKNIADRAMLKAIVVGDGKEIGLYKFKHRVADLLKSESGVTLIERTILRAKKEMAPGHKILNTNIPLEYLK